MLPPKMRFLTDMWHPNSKAIPSRLYGPAWHLLKFRCFSILNSLCRWDRLHLDSGESIRSADSHELALAQPVNHLQHAPGDDVYGYEDAGERWLPVHSVETVVSLVDALFTDLYGGSTDTASSVLLAHLGH